jgi:hypothetical protein
VQYDINIDNEGDGLPDITYRFKFTTTPSRAASAYFLYNIGVITAPNKGVYPNFSRPQTFKVTRLEYEDGHVMNATVLGTDFIVPQCNVGPLSTPNYESALASPAFQKLVGGGQVFAGQRADGFYVDLGAVFDLGNLRPFQVDRAASPFTAPAFGYQFDRSSQRALRGVTNSDHSANEH